MVKIIFDKTFAIIGLVLLFPIMVLVWVLLKSSMPLVNPFFTQKRVGVNGKLFIIYKFRTMNVLHSGSTISIKGENRITFIGAYLRKYKIDELPTLYNVLIGDMSFVGPRPDVLEYMNRLVDEERNILTLKPGITGPASIKYSNEEEILSLQDNPIKYYDEIIFPDKVKINLQYYYKNSFHGDLLLIFKTLFNGLLK